MATVYVDSAATGAADGTTKADAFTTIQAAFADASTVAGSKILCSHTHAESGATSPVWVCAGTATSFIDVVSIDFSDDTYRRGASVTATGSNTISWDNKARYAGLELNAGSACRIKNTASNDHAYFYDCLIASTRTSSAAGSVHEKGLIQHFVKCEFFFGHAGSYHAVKNGTAHLVFRGCGFAAGSAASTAPFVSAYNGGRMVFRGFDASLMSASGTFITGSASDPFKVEAWGVLLPSGAALVNMGSPNNYYSQFRAFNCGAADAIEAEYGETILGTTREDTGVYLDSEYDQSASKRSLKLTPTSQATVYNPWRWPILTRWVGANATLTVEITHDSTAFTDTQAWIEVEHPDATDEALKVRVETLAADSQGAGATLTTSAASWTSAKTNKLKISTTLTSAAGILRVWACVADNGSQTPSYWSPRVGIS